MYKAAQWTTIVYPESLREDWLKVLEIIGCEISVSPLHDRDKWTADDEKENSEHKAGTLKKAHYHIILCFAGPKTDEQVKTMLAQLVKQGSAPYPKKVEQDVPSAEDYQTHDTEECRKQGKPQYDKEKVVHLNGFDVTHYRRKKQTKKSVSYMPQVLEIIQSCDVREVWDLMLMLSVRDDADDIIAYVEHHAYLVSKLIDSRRYGILKAEQAVASYRLVQDPETGEMKESEPRVWIGDRQDKHIPFVG